VITGVFGFFYIASTFLTSYGTGRLGLSRTTVLVAGIAGGLALAATTALSAIWSDRAGRRPVMIGGFAAAAVWAFTLFPLVDSGSAAAFVAGVTGTFAVLGFSFGPMGSLLPELFDTRCRYSGAGIAYNIGGILGGAVPPLIAGPLAARWGGIAVGVLLAALALVSLACVAVVAETRTTALSGDAATLTGSS
jgi:MFS family permease